MARMSRRPTIVGVLSKHWMKADALTQIRAWPHPFFIHHFTLQLSLMPLHRLSKITTRIGIQQQGDVSGQWLRVRHRAIHCHLTALGGLFIILMCRRRHQFGTDQKATILCVWEGNPGPGGNLQNSWSLSEGRRSIADRQWLVPPISWTSCLFSFHSCGSRAATAL